jgi:molecular chaperone DnaK (HSP70)
MSARKPPPSVPEPTLVLDLGSSMLRVALVVDGRPQVIPFPAEGGRVPTVIGFDTSRINSAQDLLVLGDAARRLTITEPRTQLHGALRLAGRRHELVALDDENWRQVPVVRGPGADVQACLAGGIWPVPRVLGALIQSLVERLVRERGLRFERAIVSIAPGSDDARRRAVLQALRVAGFEHVELVHSTTAAALAWSTLDRAGTAGLGIAGLEAALAGAGKLVALNPIEDEPEAEQDDDEDEDEVVAVEPGEAESEAVEPAPEAIDGEADEADEADDADDLEPEKPREQLVLLLDLGASSFDAALARFDDADIEILAARSRIDLGGDDLDERIVDWLLGQFEDANEVDLSSDATVRARMRDVAEKIKLGLSDADRYEARLPFLWADASGPKHLFVTLERERFERMINDVVEATAALARAVLADAGHGADDLDAVVMLGGCSRVPILQDRIEGLFGRVPETELSVKALDEDFVVRGLALEAARRSHRRPPSALVDIAGRELWLRTGSDISRVVERNGARPLQRTIPLVLEGTGADRHVEFELFEGDDDDRARTLCGEVQGEAGKGGKAQLRVSVDADGCIGVQVEPQTLSLVISQRVGLSARALERLRREASERADAAASLQRSEELRRRLWTLARTIEAWLGGEGSPAIDELLRTSLTQWRRDAEVALERGDDELLCAGLDSFATLREALPNKLRTQVEEESPRPVGPGDVEAVELEPLGDPSADYDANECVDPLEHVDLESDGDEDEAEAEAAEVAPAEAAEAEEEDESAEEEEDEAAEEEEEEDEPAEGAVAEEPDEDEDEAAEDAVDEEPDEDEEDDEEADEVEEEAAEEVIEEVAAADADETAAAAEVEQETAEEVAAAVDAAEDEQETAAEAVAAAVEAEVEPADEVDGTAEVEPDAEDAVEAETEEKAEDSAEAEVDAANEVDAADEVESDEDALEAETGEKAEDSAEAEAELAPANELEAEAEETAEAAPEETAEETAEAAPEAAPEETAEETVEAAQAHGEDDVEIAPAAEPLSIASPEHSTEDRPSLDGEIPTLDEERHEAGEAAETEKVDESESAAE